MTGDNRQKAGPSGRLAPGRLVMTPGPASTQALFSSAILRRNCGDIGRPCLHPTARPSGTTVWTLTFIGPAVMGHGEASRPSSTGFHSNPCGDQPGACRDRGWRGQQATPPQQPCFRPRPVSSNTDMWGPGPPLPGPSRCRGDVEGGRGGAW